MSGYNYTCQLGRLGKDPEEIQTKNGKSMCKLSLANESGWGDNKNTEWHKVICFGKLADLCIKFLNKGDQTMVAGEIRYSKYTNKQGAEAYSTDIIANDVTFLGSKKGQASDNEEFSADVTNTIDENVPF